MYVIMTIGEINRASFYLILIFRFLNENSDLVFNELKESYEKSLSSVFQDVTNKIFDSVPMNEIFLED